MPASNLQRKMFGLFRAGRGFHYREERSFLLRDYYRIGQRLFRLALGHGWAPQEEALNDILQTLNATEREGLLMGWQSDAYAHDHGLEFAAEGIDSYAPAEL